MKLHDALFREPWLAYQVAEIDWEDEDNFSDWDLEPLSGPTLAAEDVDDVFEGLFIIAAQIVSNHATTEPCYMDVVLPERIAEYHFLREDGRVVRKEGLSGSNWTVIPAIGIEALGVYTLYYAKQNPSLGINVLRRGMEDARERAYLAYDLAFLLRDEKRYPEAIEALTVFLTEYSAPYLAPMLYQERAQMYAAIGQLDKAEADKQQFVLAFEKQYGHPPGLQDM